MDKGIRPFCNAKFLELLPQRAALGDVEYRRAVMNSVRENFDVSIASAATAYNKAKIEATKLALTDTTVAELLKGLGRPEDKKGGRKKKVEAPAAGADGGAVNPEGGEQQEEAPPAVTLFTVVKVKDKSVVAEGLTKEDADALIARAAAQKKAKLEIL